MNDHMNTLLDRAVTDGRIAPASRAAWAERFRNNPAQTEATLAMLQPTPIPAGVLGHRTDPVDAVAAAGRSLVSRTRTPVAAGGETAHAPEHPARQSEDVVLTPENVGRWTHDLFPETRAGAGAQQGRITRDAT